MRKRNPTTPLSLQSYFSSHCYSAMILITSRLVSDEVAPCYTSIESFPIFTLAKLPIMLSFLSFNNKYSVCHFTICFFNVLYAENIQIVKCGVEVNMSTFMELSYTNFVGCEK